MKIGNWTKKLSAALVAGGMMLPVAANAASLDTNLLVDPGFEDVNTTTGAYGSLELNSWTDGTVTSNFTYASGQYDLGGPLPGGGDRYFTSNGGDDDKIAPGQAAQNVDLSAGDTAAEIAAGTAAFNLSAFMTSYAGSDVAHINVEFLDGGGGSLGAFDIADADNSTWTLNSIAGAIPAGTVTARVSVYGDANASGPDGYLDNASFSVSQIPEPTSMALAGLGLAGAGVFFGRRRGE